MSWLSEPASLGQPLTETVLTLGVKFLGADLDDLVVNTPSGSTIRKLCIDIVQAYNNAFGENVQNCLVDLFRKLPGDDSYFRVPTVEYKTGDTFNNRDIVYCKLRRKAADEVTPRLMPVEHPTTIATLRSAAVRDAIQITPSTRQSLSFIEDAESVGAPIGSSDIPVPTRSIRKAAESNSREVDESKNDVAVVKKSKRVGDSARKTVAASTEVNNTDSSATDSDDQLAHAMGSRNEYGNDVVKTAVNEKSSDKVQRETNILEAEQSTDSSSKVKLTRSLRKQKRTPQDSTSNQEEQVGVHDEVTKTVKKAPRTKKPAEYAEQKANGTKPSTKKKVTGKKAAQKSDIELLPEIQPSDGAPLFAIEQGLNDASKCVTEPGLEKHVEKLLQQVDRCKPEVLSQGFKSALSSLHLSLINKKSMSVLSKSLKLVVDEWEHRFKPSKLVASPERTTSKKRAIETDKQTASGSIENPKRRKKASKGRSDPDSEIETKQSAKKSKPTSSNAASSKKDAAKSVAKSKRTKSINRAEKAMDSTKLSASEESDSSKAAEANMSKEKKAKRSGSKNSSKIDTKLSGPSEDGEASSEELKTPKTIGKVKKTKASKKRGKKDTEPKLVAKKITEITKQSSSETDDSSASSPKANVLVAGKNPTEVDGSSSASSSPARTKQSPMNTTNDSSDDSSPSAENAAASSSPARTKKSPENTTDESSDDSSPSAKKADLQIGQKRNAEQQVSDDSSPSTKDVADVASDQSSIADATQKVVLGDDAPSEMGHNIASQQTVVEADSPRALEAIEQKEHTKEDEKSSSSDQDSSSDSVVNDSKNDPSLKRKGKMAKQPLSKKQGVPAVKKQPSPKKKVNKNSLGNRVSETASTIASPRKIEKTDGTVKRKRSGSSSSSSDSSDSEGEVPYAPTTTSTVKKKQEIKSKRSGLMGRASSGTAIVAPEQIVKKQLLGSFTPKFKFDANASFPNTQRRKSYEKDGLNRSRKKTGKRKKTKHAKH